MNLKKASIFISFIFMSYSLAACDNQINQPLIIEDNATINSRTETAQDLIKKFADSYSQVKDFTGIVTMADSKNGNPSDAVVGDSKISFKKERNERLEITKSSDTSKVGTIVAYKGGDKVQVLLAKPIPILGKKFNLSINDKRIATSRGYAFDQLDITAMLNRFNKAGVQLDIVSRSNLNGLNMVKISGKGTFKGIDSEVTEEVLTLDTATMLPVQDDVMVKDKTVLKISLSDLKLNVGLKDDLFNL